MGSIVAVASHRGRPTEDIAARMVREAPHRGELSKLIVKGQCLLATSDRPERREGSLAERHGYAVAFSGALDNRLELAESVGVRPLDRAGVPSARVVLEGIHKHGIQFAGRMRGAFSAAVTDGHRLWCFRDQLGFRTLTYREQADGVYVATEAKQVVAGAGIGYEPDLDVLQAIFFHTLDDETPTALKGVRRLPKATILEVETSLRTHRYWNPEDLLETASPTADEITEAFHGLMDQAVRRTLSGNDVISLSGGIDSPAVAAYAAPAHLEVFGKQLSAITALYPDQPSVDERDYTTAVAEFLDIPLYTYDRKAGTLDDVRDWVRLTDGPVPRLLLSDAAEHYRHVRGLGFRSMLTGEIAEFLVDRRRFLTPHLLLTGRFEALGMHIRAQRRKGWSWVKIARQFGPAITPAWLEREYYRFVTPRRERDRIPTWIDYREILADYQRAATSPRRRWPLQQLMGFIGPGVTLEAEEICQELMGVRTRRPWADVDLWEFFLSLPAELKMPGLLRKELVRALLRGKVPDMVLDRTDKTVFDQSIEARMDYEALRKWLSAASHRLRGVDYGQLWDHLDRESLSLGDYQWARDLAAVHAFLDLWS